MKKKKQISETWDPGNFNFWMRVFDRDFNKKIIEEKAHLKISESH